MREKEFRQNLRETGYFHMILDFIRVASFLVVPSCFLNCELQISVGIAGPQPFNRELQNLNGHSGTASSRSQWALPDLNREFRISVGTAGPQPQTPDLSGHCRTSTASSQWALPHVNCECALPHQPRAPDLSGHSQTTEIWRSRLRSGSAHVRGTSE